MVLVHNMVCNLRFKERNEILPMRVVVTTRMEDTKKIRLRLLGTNNACRVCVPKCKVKKKLTSDVLQDRDSRRC